MKLQELIVKAYNEHGYIPSIVFKNGPNIMELTDEEILNMEIKTFEIKRSSNPTPLKDTTIAVTVQLEL